MNVFAVSLALLTLCNLATFLLSLPPNLMAEKRHAQRESSATNKTTLLKEADSSVEQKNAPHSYQYMKVSLSFTLLSLIVFRSMSFTYWFSFTRKFFQFFLNVILIF
jgi:hypothetical protein